MIDYIEGPIVKKSPARLIVKCGGVGYGVNTNIQTAALVVQNDISYSFFIHTYVKEDTLELYGFLSEREKDIFTSLISVSGIGPKMGLRILSGNNIDSIVKSVVQGDVKSLKSIKGVGAKTAELMVLSLKSKFERFVDGNVEASTSISEVSDAIKALISLGVKDSQAKVAVEKVVNKSEGGRSISEIISEALKLI